MAFKDENDNVYHRQKGKRANEKEQQKKTTLKCLFKNHFEMNEEQKNRKMKRACFIFNVQ